MRAQVLLNVPGSRGVKVIMKQVLVQFPEHLVGDTDSSYVDNGVLTQWADGVCVCWGGVLRFQQVLDLFIWIF